MARRRATRQVTRDAGTGRFVRKRRAKTAPTRTVTETVRVRRKRR